MTSPTAPGTPIALPPFIHQFRINHFLQGALTTYSGARGSFVGPWTTSPVEATSNGLPWPSGTVRVSPSSPVVGRPGQQRPGAAVGRVQRLGALSRSRRGALAPSVGIGK